MIAVVLWFITILDCVGLNQLRQSTRRPVPVAIVERDAVDLSGGFMNGGSVARFGVDAVAESCDVFEDRFVEGGMGAVYGQMIRFTPQSPFLNTSMLNHVTA